MPENVSFSPRPVAHPMHCAELMKPVRRAVSDLLLRLKGAEDNRIVLSNKDSNQRMVLGNCFLVYGARGTGKTTVLLSAREAVRSTKEFFKDAQSIQDSEQAKEILNKLKGTNWDVKWLDILDLEPLPADANLLTILLTRLHNALYTDENGKSVTTRPSVFEESDDSARRRFGQLINDATLMQKNGRKRVE